MKIQLCRRIRLMFGLLGVVITIAFAGGECRAGIMINVGNYEFADSDPTLDQNNAKALFQTAIKTWESQFTNYKTINVTLNIDYVDFAQRGKDSDSFYNGKPGGNPQKPDTLDPGDNGETENPTKQTVNQNGLILSVGEIDIVTDKGVMFFADPKNLGAPIPNNRVDAYTTMLHELGHALGFNDYPMWINQIQGSKFTISPAYGGGTVNMNGPYHIAATDPKSPNDLMSSSLGRGQRRLPSATDVQMLETAYDSVTPEPSSAILLGTGAMALFGYCWRRRKPVARDANELAHVP